MSEPSLPDDVTRWPSDPYELLGVQRGIAPKDLKRVYTRLIKVWKPEHHPEHFRLIRQAYEAVLRYIEIFGESAPVFDFQVFQPTPPREEPATEERTAPAHESETCDQARSEPDGERPIIVDPPARLISDIPPEELPYPLEPPVKSRPRRETLAELWERAIHGEEAEAYRGLLGLVDETSELTNLVVRLYWLLSLDPALDPNRQPCDWLILGLSATRLRGPCMELYRREIEAEPEEAFSERFANLLRLDVPTGLLTELLVWRWGAVRRRKRWDILESDLAMARQRIARLDDSSWFRLLLVAGDGVAWIGMSEPYDRLWYDLQTEVKQLQHLANRHGEWFDRLDFLTALRNDWLRAREQCAAPAHFLALISDGWHSPFHLTQPVLLKVLAEMIEQPLRWLAHFDWLQRVGPAALAGFAELLRQHEARVENPPEKPAMHVIARLTTEFIASPAAKRASEFRHQVVNFCFREGIQPEWMLEALVNQEVPWNSAYVDPQAFVRLSEDWPVRYLCLAHRLFWS